MSRYFLRMFSLDYELSSDLSINRWPFGWPEHRGRPSSGRPLCFFSVIQKIQFGIELTIAPIAARSTPVKTTAVMPIPMKAAFSPFHLYMTKKTMTSINKASNANKTVKDMLTSPYRLFFSMLTRCGYQGLPKNITIGPLKHLLSPHIPGSKRFIAVTKPR